MFGGLLAWAVGSGDPDQPRSADWTALPFAAKPTSATRVRLVMYIVSRASRGPRVNPSPELEHP